MIHGPDAHTCKVTALKLVLKLDVRGALVQSPQRGPSDVQSNTMATLSARYLPLLLCQCLLVPLCDKVPSNKLPGNMEASKDTDHFMTIARTVFRAHGTIYFSFFPVRAYKSQT